jgi:hypothetical protein
MWKFKVIDSQGQGKTGTMSGANAKSVYDGLMKKGYIPIGIRQAS